MKLNFSRELQSSKCMVKRPGPCIATRSFSRHLNLLRPLSLFLKIPLITWSEKFKTAKIPRFVDSFWSCRFSSFRRTVGFEFCGKKMFPHVTLPASSCAFLCEWFTGVNENQLRIDLISKALRCASRFMICELLNWLLIKLTFLPLRTASVRWTSRIIAVEETPTLALIVNVTLFTSIVDCATLHRAIH